MTAADRRAVPSNVRTLFPGYFAMVMATGIVAVGAAQQDISVAPEVLYAIAAATYVLLVALTAVRAVRYPRLLVADVTSHTKGFAFLTIVAATNVLGSASVVVHGWTGLAWGLWWAGLALWALLVYAAIISVILRGPKPELGKGLNGTWFLLTVATESVVVLGAILYADHPADLLAFGCIAAFVLGIVLYLIVMTMVFLRWTFQELEPTEADPPSWIAAGAVAITVLAGSSLLGHRAISVRIERLAPFIEGMVVLAWATATFWFPVMVAIGVWRHVINKVPLRYHPSYWSLVFPLGMYGAATFRMRAVIELQSLAWVPKAALAAALIAWTAAFLGLLLQGARALSRTRSTT
jgi:tellurite resistance protein TehA-like permease